MQHRGSIYAALVTAFLAPLVAPPGLAQNTAETDSRTCVGAGGCIVGSVVRRQAERNADIALEPVLRGVEPSREAVIEAWSQAKPGIDYVAHDLLVMFEAGQFEGALGGVTEFSDEATEQRNEELKGMAQLLAEQRGYQLADTSPALRSARFVLPEGTDPRAEARQLFRRPDIEAAEPNWTVRPNLYPGSPPVLPQDWRQYSAHSDVGAVRAADTKGRNDNVRVAVIDTGGVSHPNGPALVSSTDDRDFVTFGAVFSSLTCAGPIVPDAWDLSGYDADARQTMDLIVFDDPTDSLPPCHNANGSGSHGQKIAGIIASHWDAPPFPSNPRDVYVAGIAGRVNTPAQPQVRLNIIHIQIFDSASGGTVWDMSQGVLYAAGWPASNGSGGTIRMDRVDIANMSFAYDSFSFIGLNALSVAWASDMLMIAGSGNDGQQIAKYPSAFFGVVAVGGNIPLGDAYPKTNTGPHIELTAPAVRVNTTGYDFSGCPVAPGLQCIDQVGGAPEVSLMEGTSAATAIVSGIAAVYKAHNPSWNAATIRAQLQQNAVDLGGPGLDDVFGFGLVQAAPGRAISLMTSYEDTMVFLIDAATGAVSQNILASSSGQFQFQNVQSGSYYVIAGTDEDFDGVYGETGEAVGAHAVGAAADNLFQQATAVAVNGILDSTQVTVDLGWPGDEPPNNDNATTAGRLFLNHYAEVGAGHASDVDWLEFQIPAADEYRIWTEGRNTVNCLNRHGDMEPIVTLFESDAVTVVPPKIGPGDGIHSSSSCAEIIADLTAGTYYLKIEPEPTSVAEGTTILRLVTTTP